MLFLGKSQLFEDFLDPYVVFVHRVLFDADHLQLAQAFVDLLVVEIPLHVEFLFLLDSVKQALVPVEYGIGDGEILEGVLVLSQYTHFQAASDDDLAARRILFTGDDFEESTFTGAVGTDETVAFAGVEFEIDIFEQHTAAEPFGQIDSLQHSLFILLPVQ